VPHPCAFSAQGWKSTNIRTHIEWLKFERPRSGDPADRSWSVGWRSGFSDLGNHEPYASEL
jgi:hypothetical protein